MAECYDVLVLSGESDIGLPASRLVLTAISGYFRSYFSRWSRTTPGEVIKVNLDKHKAIFELSVRLEVVQKYIRMLVYCFVSAFYYTPSG